MHVTAVADHAASLVQAAWRGFAWRSAVSKATEDAFRAHVSTAIVAWCVWGIIGPRPVGVDGTGLTVGHDTLYRYRAQTARRSFVAARASSVRIQSSYRTHRAVAQLRAACSAATTLQAALRRSIVLARAKRCASAALRLTSFWRGSAARLALSKSRAAMLAELVEARRKCAAARKIQRRFRGILRLRVAVVSLQSVFRAAAIRKTMVRRSRLS